MYLVFVLIGIFVCLHLIKQTLSLYKYKDFPGPSPFLSLPLIGHGYLLGPNIARGLQINQEKHGDIFRFDLGGVPTVHICTQELATKAFKLDAFNGKPSQRVMDAVAKKDKHGEPC